MATILYMISIIFGQTSRQNCIYYKNSTKWSNNSLLKMVYYETFGSIWITELQHAQKPIFKKK